MGFDLHTHSSTVACGPSCLTQKQGRRLQLQAQMETLSSRPDLFFVTKAIDGIPRVNGSQVIMAMRAAKFLFRQFRRQDYYESLPTAEDTQRVLVDALTLRAQLSFPFSDGVTIVVEAFESWHTAPNGVIPMPHPGDRSIGLHNVALTHYTDSGDTLGFANSWGRRWGNHGYGTMSFDYARQHFHEGHVLRHARWGSTAWKFYGNPNPSRRELRERLLIENPRERHKHRIADDDNWDVTAYVTISPATSEPVLCVEITNGFGLKMGWAFFRSSSAPPGRVLEITELFVWPTFRRMGIGRMLEKLAQEYARAWQCLEIQLMMNEADAVVGPLIDPPRQTARLFAQALGYEWKWRPELGPRRPATALKRIAP